MRVLLKADAGAFGLAYTDQQIQKAIEVSRRTIQRTRQTFALEGLDAALTPKRCCSCGTLGKFDGESAFLAKCVASLQLTIQGSG